MPNRIRFTFLAVAVLGVLLSVSPLLHAVEVVPGQPLLQYVTPDSAVLLVGKPRSLIKDTEQAVLGDVAYLGQFPIPPSEIEHVAVMGGGSPDDVFLTLAFRFTRPFSAITVGAWLSPQAEKVEGSGIPTFMTPEEAEPPAFQAGNFFNSSSGFIMPDRQTAIVSFNRQHLRRIAQRIKRGDTSTGEVSRQVRRLSPDSNFALILDTQQLLMRSQLQDEVLQLRPETQDFPLELLTTSLEANFGKRDNQMHIRFTCRNKPQDYERVKAFVATAGNSLSSLMKFGLPSLKSRLTSGSAEKVDHLTSQLAGVLSQMELAESQQEAEAGAYKDVYLQLKQAPSFSRVLMQVSNVLVVGVQEARVAARNTQQSNNFKQVMLAWHNHADSQGAFPMDIYNQEGKPLLSWRVRILPYVGHVELFKQFRLNEPWDSPHNKKLLAQMPFVYGDTHKTIRPMTTRMLAAKGKRTAMGKRLSAITDGLSNTVAIVSSANPVEWTRPADFPVPDKWNKDTKPGFTRQLHFFQKTSLIGLCDGAVRASPPVQDNSFLKLLTVDDAQVITDDVYPFDEDLSLFKEADFIAVENRYTVELAEARKLIKQLEADDPRQIRDAATKLIKSRPKWQRKHRHPMHDLQLALQLYSSRFGELPGDITDKDGNALLSWRVKVVPYLQFAGAYKLHEQFRQNEAWDSEHNRRLIAQMPSAFSPYNGKLPAGQTRLVRVTGKGTLGGNQKLRQAKDGLAGTGLLVETRTGNVWTKPGDLPLQDDLGKQLFSSSDQTHVIGMADGSLQGHPKQTTGQTWRNIFLHSNGKTYDQQPQPVQVNFEIDARIIGAARRLSKSDDAYRRRWGHLLLIEIDRDELLKEAASGQQSTLHQMLSDPHPVISRDAMRVLMAEPHATTAGILATAPARLDLAVFEWFKNAPELVLNRTITTLRNSEQLHLKHRAEQLQEALQKRRKLAAETRTPAQEEEFQQQVALSRNLLRQGQQLLGKKKISAGIQALEKMLAIERKIYGDTHDETLASVKYLMNLYGQLDQSQQMIDMAELRRAFLAKKFGATHPATRSAQADVSAFKTVTGLTAEQKNERQAINQLFAEATRLAKANESKKSLELLRQVVERRRKLYGKDSVLLLSALRALRRLTFKAGLYQELVTVSQETARVSTALVGEDSPIALADLSELAYARIKAGKPDEGLQLLKRLQTRSYPPESRPLIARDARYTAQQLAGRNKLSEAAPLLMKSLKISNELDNHSDAGNVCWRLSSYSDKEIAFAWRNQSLWHYQKAKPLEGYLFNYPGLADAMRSQGKHHLELVLWKTLIAVLQRGVEAKQIGLLPLARSLTDLATCYLLIGDFEAADVTLARCTKITGDYRGDAFVFDYLSALAKVARHRGNIAKAEKWLREAVQVSRLDTVGFLAQQARANRQLAELLASKGETREALELLELSGRVRYSAPLAERIRVLQTKASIQLQAGKTEEAKTTAKAAFESLKGLELPSHLQATLNLEQAGLWLSLGNNQDAQAAASMAKDKAAQASGEDSLKYIQALAMLARVEWKRGDTKSASRTALLALNGASRVVETSAYVLSPRQQLGFSRLMRSSLDLYLSIAASDPAEAANCFTAIFRWKGAGMVRQRLLHKLSEQEGVAPFYQQVTAITRQLATTARKVTPVIQSEDPRTQQAARNLEEQNKLVAALSYVRDLQQAQLSTSRLAYMDLPAQETVPSFIDSLPEDGVFIDYFVVNAETTNQIAAAADTKAFVLACVITKDGKITTHRLGSAAKTAAGIVTWRSTFGASADSKAAGKGLRESLWAPLMKRVGNAKIILLSPDDVLGQLPFNALPNKAGKGYLVEDHRIAIVAVPQLLPQLLNQKQHQPDDASDMLLIGDVDYNLVTTQQPAQEAVATASQSDLRAIRQGSQFAPLPGTRDEVQVIQQLFASQNADAALRLKKLTRGQASETAFRVAASSARTIHVATHGYFAPPPATSATGSLQAFHPGMLSGIALAGANKPERDSKDDGVLTAAEIATLQMENVDLAVLSACETGLGQVAGGEGLLGIQRSFQVAGAGATVASLWQVPDQATRVLMERFYRNYWGKKMSRLDALREAQIFLLNTPAAVNNPELVRGDLRLGGPSKPQNSTRLMPRSWAAFILSGDWR